MNVFQIGSEQSNKPKISEKNSFCDFITLELYCFRVNERTCDVLRDVITPVLAADISDSSGENECRHQRGAGGIAGRGTQPADQILLQRKRRQKSAETH